MRFVRYLAADLIKVHLHGLGVCPRQHEGRTCTAPGADSAEQIGVVVSLIGRLARPGSLPRPQPNLSVLLADTGLILEPDFYRRASGKIGYVGGKRVDEVFLKALMILASWAGWRGLALMWEKPMALSSLEMVRSL